METKTQPSLKEKCEKCKGAGEYMYDENHIKPCEACCDHSGWYDHEKVVPKVIALISRVEETARKDERSRVVLEARKLIEGIKLEEAPPFSASNEFREKASLINENLMPLVKARLMEALKGLDNNK